jgi:hypothetical protein
MPTFTTIKKQADSFFSDRQEAVVDCEVREQDALAAVL